MSGAARHPVSIVSLGRMPYGEALALQERLVALRQAGRIGDAILLLAMIYATPAALLAGIDPLALSGVLSGIVSAIVWLVMLGFFARRARSDGRLGARAGAGDE